MKRDSYCSFCGTAYSDTSVYPRTCSSCGIQVWANPIPVSIVLTPVQGPDGRVGLLVVRRAIEPRKGLLGLVGGFLEEHETWQVGGAREVLEEADVRLDPATLTPYWFVSTEPRPNRVLLFSLAPTVPATALPPFTPTSETSERGIVRGPQGLDDIFAFPLHARAAQRFFEDRALDGPHDYLPL
jgi:ADP-ribose pyrophosphatase YjhB (NUDIX family)